MKRLLQTRLAPETLNYLQHISRFQEQWRTVLDTSKDFYVSLKKTTLITSAGASTRIEGASLSDDDIIKRLVGLKIKKIRDRDEAEVAGYIDCKKYIFDHYGDLEISEHNIRSLHQMMMVYLPESLFPPNQKGTYKNIPNSVVRIDHDTGKSEVIFETMPPGSQTETAMRELTDDYRHFIQNPNYSDLEVIAAFIAVFLAIHPFRDGNGRISRLLTDLCLLRQDYLFCMYSSHEKIIEDNKEQYYIALRQTQISLKTKPDLNPWFIYFLKTLDQQTTYLQKKLPASKPATLTSLEEKVLDLIHKHRIVTIGFLERESKMKRVTLKSILARLKQRDLIEMEGERKTSRYKAKSSV
ncbi:MAG: Fic family protein [Deltaproteobacteria bacterium]|nr:Fic family protein [Deltaproteobacteria bacterium]